MDPDDSIVGSDLLSEVISVGPMITIICDKAPVKDLEVDIARPATGSGLYKPLFNKYSLIWLNNLLSCTYETPVLTYVIACYRKVTGFKI